MYDSPARRRSFVVLLTLAALVTLGVAGAAAAPTDSASDGATNLSSDTYHWEGQALAFDTDDANATYELFRVGGAEGGGLEPVEFVENVTLASDGSGAVDTGHPEVSPGMYVLLDQNGDAVVFEDGAVERRFGSQYVDAATFTVREQALDATLSRSGTVGESPVTLSVASTRAAYDLAVASPNLTDAELSALVGDTTLSVRNSVATFELNASGLDAGTYTIEFSAQDTGASDTVTLTVGSAVVFPTPDAAHLEPAADQWLNGTSSLAPGTNISFEVRGPNFLDIRTVTIQADGTFAERIDLSDLDNGDGLTVRSAESTYDAEVTYVVGTRVDVTVPGAVGPAASHDGDSLLEDVDGDGDTDVFDAITYYNNRDTEAITDHPSAFDFDGEGETGTVFDAIALYNHITEPPLNQ